MRDARSVSRALTGALLLAPAAWLWLTRGEVLLAGHPALAVLAGVAGLLGLGMVVSAVRHRGERPVHERPRWRVVLVRGAGLLAAAVVAAALVYLRPFAATDAAVEATEADADADSVAVTTSPTRITLTPTSGEPSTGLVFQPGARVDPRAYVPLLREVASAGHLVVIVKQPFNIGFLAVGAPGDVIDDHPEIARWAVGGHSLGGVAASSYAADNRTGYRAVQGLLLWASYPLDSLASADLAVTSVSGTEDALSTPDDIEESRADLPGDTVFVPVEGAVHAFFGDYGAQPGDGTPTVDRDEAQRQIVTASEALLERVEKMAR